MELLTAIASGFLSPVGIALATAMFAYGRYIFEQEHQRKTLLNALFAELVNIREHYAYASLELPTDTTDQFQLKKRLKWSKYGSIRSTNDLGKLGFLDAGSITELLQLELRIRNDNTYIDQLLESPSDITKSRLSEIKGRLSQRRAEAFDFLRDFVSKRPELTEPLAIAEQKLPEHEVRLTVRSSGQAKASLLPVAELRHWA